MWEWDSGMTEERRRAFRLLNNIPEDRLMYVIGFLEGASIPETTPARRERSVSAEGKEGDPFYSPENLARLKRSIAQMEATGGTVH